MPGNISGSSANNWKTSSLNNFTGGPIDNDYCCWPHFLIRMIATKSIFMKKVWSLLAGITAMATTATAQLRFAPELGMNFANLHGKYDDATGDRKKVDGTI